MLCGIGVSLLALAIGGCGGSGHRAVVMKPPTLPTKPGPNSVARFPCPKKEVSTIDIESCSLRRTLTLNAAINRRVTQLWALFDAVGRRELVDAEKGWNAYVTSKCEYEARRYLGGTGAGVVAGSCWEEATRVHLRDLTATVFLFSHR